MRPKPTDFVKFVHPLSEASRFCSKHGITGKVIEYDKRIFVVDVGFPYHIYALEAELEVIAEQSAIPQGPDAVGDVE